MIDDDICITKTISVLYTNILKRGLASQKIGGIELPPGPEVGTRLLGGSQAVSLGYMRHITTTDISLSLGYILW